MAAASVGKVTLFEEKNTVGNRQSAATDISNKHSQGKILFQHVIMPHLLNYVSM